MLMSAVELWSSFERDEEDRRKSGVEAHPMYYSDMQTKALIIIAAHLEEISKRLDGWDEEE